MTKAKTFYENKSYVPITNKELRDILEQYPDDAIVCIEYCNVRELKYYEDRNLIAID